MKIDLERERLEMFYKHWQVPLVELLDGPTHNEENPLRTREAWIYVNDQLPKGETISRASVIIFLQGQEEEGWITSRKESGKGGYHDVYWRAMRLRDFLYGKLGEFEDKLRETCHELNIKLAV